MITSIGYYETELKLGDTLEIGEPTKPTKIYELVGINETKNIRSYELGLREFFQEARISSAFYNMPTNKFKDGRKIIYVNGRKFKVRNTLEVELI